MPEINSDASIKSIADFTVQLEADNKGKFWWGRSVLLIKDVPSKQGESTIQVYAEKIGFWDTIMGFFGSGKVGRTKEILSKLYEGFIDQEYETKTVDNVNKTFFEYLRKRTKEGEYQLKLRKYLRKNFKKNGVNKDKIDGFVQILRDLRRKRLKATKGSEGHNLELHEEVGKGLESLSKELGIKDSDRLEGLLLDNPKLGSK